MKDTKDIIIESLVERVKVLEQTLSSREDELYDRLDERIFEILGIYEYINSVNGAVDMIDYLYDKAMKTKKESDVVTAFNAVDYYCNIEGSQEKWDKLSELKKELGL